MRRPPCVMESKAVLPLLFWFWGGTILPSGEPLLTNETNIIILHPLHWKPVDPSPTRLPITAGLFVALGTPGKAR